jgi:hypothetical protein
MIPVTAQNRTKMRRPTRVRFPPPPEEVLAGGGVGWGVGWSAAVAVG